MASVLPAIEEYLRTAKSLGILKYYILSYDDTVPEKMTYESTNALNELIHKLNAIVTEKKPQQDVPEQTHAMDISAKIDECVEKNDDLQKLNKDDDRLVQIRVDRNEMNRRIDAFINRKRKEVDTNNAKEFCNNILLDDDNPVIEDELVNSCARIDSIFVPRSGCKSHVKVYRVNNTWGPQTYQSFNERKDIKSASLEFRRKSLEDIEERLRNMESHLKMKSGNNIRLSIYSRLKNLEDRILFLEGMSPDYFNASAYVNQSSRGSKRDHPYQVFNKSSSKRFKKENPYQNYSFEELQMRMKNLKQQLKLRSQNLTKYASQTKSV